MGGGGGVRQGGKGKCEREREEEGTHAEMGGWDEGGGVWGTRV